MNAKPWFNDKCEQKRKLFFSAKNNIQLNNSDRNKLLLKQASKNYKKQLRIEHRLYFKNLNDRIRKLSKNDPKEFWKIINKENKTKQSNTDIPDISEFTEHFKSLNEGQEISEETETELKIHSSNNTNEEMDKPITEQEIIFCIGKLKNNKACGDDFILNEYLKCSSTIMINIYVKLFNAVMDSGITPDSWACGIILPLFKKKGVKSDVDNYRGITLLSCLGKLFTSIINNRLTKFAESAYIIGPEQAGFRKGYSTIDHIFTFKCLLDLYLSKKKRLYCAFIDYKKAFDNVDRLELWKKLVQNGVSGKCFNVIYNLYKKAKSCVQVNGSRSDFF